MDSIHFLLVLAVASVSLSEPTPEPRLNVPMARRFDGIYPSVQRFNRLFPNPNWGINPSAWKQRFRNPLWRENQVNLNLPPISGYKEVGANQPPCDDEQLQALNDNILQRLSLEQSLNNDQINPLLVDKMLLAAREGNLQRFPIPIGALQQLYGDRIPPQIDLALQEYLATGQLNNLPRPLRQLILAQGVEGNRLPIQRLGMSDPEIWDQQPLLEEESADGNIQTRKPFVYQISFKNKPQNWANRPYFIDQQSLNQPLILANNIPLQLASPQSGSNNGQLNGGQFNWSNQQGEANQPQILPQQSQQQQVWQVPQPIVVGSNGAGVQYYQPIQVAQQPCDDQVTGNSIIPMTLIVPAQQLNEGSGQQPNQLPILQPVVGNAQNNGGLYVLANLQQPLSSSTTVQPASPEQNDTKPANAA